jgi:hypothetical protein
MRGGQQRDGESKPPDLYLDGRYFKPLKVIERVLMCV